MLRFLLFSYLYLTVNVLLADIPVFEISGSRQLCQGESLLLAVNYEADTQYEWLNPFGHFIGDSSVVNFPNPIEGIYTVKIQYQDTLISLESEVSVSYQVEAGVLSGNREICKDEGESGVIVLKNHTGEIIRWESSLSGEVPWQTISHQIDSLPWKNLPVTTWFRAVISNHICEEVYSNVVKITVKEQPQAGYLIGPEMICDGQTDQKLRLVANTAEVRYWQKRTFNSAWQTVFDEDGNAFDENFLPVSGLNETAYFRAAIAHDGCEVVFTNPYYLEKEVDAEIDFETSPVCLGTESHFTAPEASRYLWDFGDGKSSVLQNPVHLFETAGLHEVTLMVETASGCEFSTTKTVRVYATPLVSFNTDPLCFTTTVDFNITSTKSDSFVFYHWDFGDGQTDSSNSEKVSHHYEKPGYYQVKLQAENAWGCISEMIKEIAVFPHDTTRFNAQLACAGDTSFFQSQTIAPGNARFLWDFGDGSIEEGKVVSHVFENSGNYNVQLKIIHEFCTDSAVTQIWVLPGTVMGTLDGDTTVCASINEGSIKLSNYNGAVQYWEVRTDPNGGWMKLEHQSDSYTFENLKTDTWFRVVSGYEHCGFGISNTVKIQVNPAPSGGVLFGSSEICSGDSPAPLVLNDYSGQIIHWLSSVDEGESWSIIENQESVLNLEHLDQTTLFKVKIGNDQCTVIYSSLAEIRVFKQPDIDFVAEAVCLGKDTNFQIYSTDPEVEVASYIWDFSDGYSSVIAAPVHRFRNAGEFEVKLTVKLSSGCTNTVSRFVEVYENPISDFLLSDVCIGEESYFENLSSHPDSQLSYNWEFGNDEFSSALNPRITYTDTGTYTVTLTVSTAQGCRVTSTQSLTVFPKPELSVSADSAMLKEGNSTLLHASGGIYYKWEPSEYLNDPDIANPLATPDQSTVFSVTTIDENGCSQTADLFVEVIEKPDDRIHVFASQVLTPDQNGKNDYWIIQNIENYPNSEVTVFNRWGDIVFEQRGYRNDWEGRRGADLLPDGVYYFRIAFTHTSHIYSGSLTILRNKP